MITDRSLLRYLAETPATRQFLINMEIVTRYGAPGHFYYRRYPERDNNEL